MTREVALELDNRKAEGALLSPDKHKTYKNKRRSLPLILGWLMTRGASSWRWTTEKRSDCSNEERRLRVPRSVAAS